MSMEYIKPTALFLDIIIAIWHPIFMLIQVLLLFCQWYVLCKLSWHENCHPISTKPWNVHKDKSAGALEGNRTGIVDYKLLVGLGNS